MKNKELATYLGNTGSEAVKRTWLKITPFMVHGFESHLVYLGGFILRLICIFIVFIQFIYTQWSHSVVVSTSDFESDNLGSNPGETFMSR